MEIIERVKDAITITQLADMCMSVLHYRRLSKIQWAMVMFYLIVSRKDIRSRNPFIWKLRGILRMEPGCNQTQALTHLLGLAEVKS